MKECARARGQAKALEEVAQQEIVEEALRNGKILCPPGSTPELIKAAVVDDIERKANAYLQRMAIAQTAYAMLPQETKEKPLDLNPAFSSRIYQYCGEVSDEEVFSLWTKLLAEEIQRPNSISLRTLNALHNMTGLEARTLKKYTPIIISGILINDELTKFDPPEHLYKDYDILYDAGLIAWRNFVSSIEIQPQGKFEYHTLNSIVTISNTSISDAINIAGIPLTQAGRELARLDSLFLDTVAILKTIPEQYRSYISIEIKQI